MFPDKMTIGEKYSPAMKITDQVEADAYFNACVEHTMRVAKVGFVEAVKIEKSNLGYYAGYYDTETMQRVNRLFSTQHPVFGNVAPTPEEAMEAGKRAALGSDDAKPEV